MNGKTHGKGAAAGNPGDRFPHQPVLYQDVLDALMPETDGRYLDGTIGAGGHAEGILHASAPEGRLLGLDLDPEALEIARQRLIPFGDRALIRQASYSQAPAVLSDLGWQEVQGILLDLGVSSMQIDQPERGFSFMEDGPINMRFDQSREKSAEDLVNALSEEMLADIIWRYGEERYSRRIARAIVAARPLHSTRALAEVIRSAVPGYDSHIHPATRTFQALRIATNQELEILSTSLEGLIECLSPGARIAVISFHSLEDRIVKQFFKRESKDCICPPQQPICTCGHQASLKIVTKKPVVATKQEVQQNPRSSSAKLRVAEKIAKA